MTARYLLFPLLLLINVSGWAQTDDEITAVATPPESQPMDNSLLLQHLPKKDIRWLDVNGQQVLTLYLKGRNGKARGGVIIIPGRNQGPTSPRIINGLRHTLANNRWYTLTLSMPANRQSQTTAAIIDSDATENTEDDDENDADESATDATNESPTNDNGALAQAYIRAGINYLNQQGVFSISLIGEGIGASYALQFINNLPPIDPRSATVQQIRGVVIINARNTLSNDHIKLSTAIGKLTMPILDLYSNEDYRDLREAKARQLAGEELTGKLYSQIQLPPTGPNWQTQDDRLTKRIRGWLNKNTSGFNVNQAAANQ